MSNLGTRGKKAVGICQEVWVLGQGCYVFQRLLVSRPDDVAIFNQPLPDRYLLHFASDLTQFLRYTSVGKPVSFFIFSQRFFPVLRFFECIYRILPQLTIMKKPLIYEVNYVLCVIVSFYKYQHISRTQLFRRFLRYAFGSGIKNCGSIVLRE